MNILYHCTFSNQDIFLNFLKKFKSYKIFTLDDNIQLDKIEAALVWNLPDKILKELTIKSKDYFFLRSGGRPYIKFI